MVIGGVGGFAGHVGFVAGYDGRSDSRPVGGAVSGDAGGFGCVEGCGAEGRG